MPQRHIRELDCNEKTRPWQWKAARGTAFTVLADYGAAALESRRMCCSNCSAIYDRASTCLSRPGIRSERASSKRGEWVGK